MDISTVRSVFGVMPIGHLTAAQILAKKKRNQMLIIGGACLAVGIGFYLGMKYEKARNRRIQLKNLTPGTQVYNQVPKPQLNSEKPVTQKSEVPETEASFEPSATGSV